MILPKQLVLIPTPIAPTSLHLPQITENIQEITHFFVENIRSARRFIASLKAPITIDELTFETIDNRSDEEIEVILKNWLSNTYKVGLLSEAGCPAIADPGAEVVRVAHRLGIDVKPLVGSSSIFLALMASGLSGQNFAFHGYLPISRNERKLHLKQLEKESLQKKQTQIFIETPYRNQSLVEDILMTLQQNTLLCLAHHIQATDEFIQTKTIREWRKKEVLLEKNPVIFLFLSQY